jgi:hypothetical protein
MNHGVATAEAPRKNGRILVLGGIIAPRWVKVVKSFVPANETNGPLGENAV